VALEEEEEEEEEEEVLLPPPPLLLLGTPPPLLPLPLQLLLLPLLLLLPGVGGATCMAPTSRLARPPKLALYLAAMAAADMVGSPNLL
jgi:hypothetical protein